MVPYTKVVWTDAFLSLDGLFTSAWLPLGLLCVSGPATLRGWNSQRGRPRSPQGPGAEGCLDGDGGGDDSGNGVGDCSGGDDDGCNDDDASAGWRVMEGAVELMVMAIEEVIKRLRWEWCAGHQRGKENVNLPRPAL